MRIEDIEADLERRIEETQDWLNRESSPEISGLEARGTSCTATVIALISDPKRKESDGVRFRLEYGTESKRYESQAEVRIKASPSGSSDGQGIANGPYVAVYVLDVESGTGLLSFFDQFDNADVYFRSADSTIEEWYTGWLRRLLRQERGNIIFKHKRPIG